MKERKVVFKYNGEKIKIRALSNALLKAKGLMFTRRKNAKALLFEFANKKNLAIHSFFVFFPFVAVWLDENNRVIQIKKVKPFTWHVKPKKKFSKLVEIPINNKYNQIIKNL